MDTGETLGKDHTDIEEARLHGGMFTRAALTVVVLGHDDTGDAVRLIVLGSRRHLFVLSVELILHMIALTVESIDGAHEQIVGDVLQMSTEAEPGPGHGDVVRCAFALGLDEQWHVDEVFAIPCGERREPLQAFGVGADHDLNVIILVRWHEESFFLQLFDIAHRLSIAHVKPFRGEGVARRFIEPHLVAVLVRQLVHGRVEVEAACDGECHDHLRRTDEGVGVGVAIGAAAEVTVERGHNRVLARVVVGVSLPLSDARTAGIGHDHTANLSEIFEDAVTFRRVADHLRAGVDDQLRLDGNVFGCSLTCHGGRARQILVRRVRAGAHERYFHFQRIAFFRCFRAHF